MSRIGRIDHLLIHAQFPAEPLSLRSSHVLSVLVTLQFFNTSRFSRNPYRRALFSVIFGTVVAEVRLALPALLLSAQLVRRGCASFAPFMKSARLERLPEKRLVCASEKLSTSSSSFQEASVVRGLVVVDDVVERWNIRCCTYLSGAHTKKKYGAPSEEKGPV